MKVRIAGPRRGAMPPGAPAPLAGAHALAIYTRAIWSIPASRLVGDCELVHEKPHAVRSVMKNIACQLEHAVEAEVTSSFAGTGGPISITGTIRLLSFDSTAHSPVARGERPSFRGRSRCAGRFVTFGLARVSSSTCRSTGPSCRVSGCLTRCRNSEHGLRNVSSSRSTMQRHT